MYVKVPAFQYPGGKALITKWLLGHFPRSGRRYLEPFAGRGNVFFAARSALRFERWHVNDVNTAPFFRALQEVDLRSLPEKVDRRIFDWLKAHRELPVALVLEPRVTFFGMGYDSTLATPPPGREGYAGHRYRQVVAAARELLGGAVVSGASWEALPWWDLDHRDFVYLDPPYLGGYEVHYGQVDHDALLDLLLRARFRWVLSGYDSALYRRRLGSPRARKARHAKMTTRAGEQRVEYLWANFDDRPQGLTAAP